MYLDTSEPFKATESYIREPYKWHHCIYVVKYNKQHEKINLEYSKNLYKGLITNFEIISHYQSYPNHYNLYFIL